MKKSFLILIGFFVIALSAVIFVACNDEKNSKSGDNSELVGTWKYIDEYQSYYGGREYYVLITFNDDSTGKIKERGGYYDITITTDFTYSYDSKKEILKLDIDDDNYYSAFGYASYYSGYAKYKVDWIGDDRFYLCDATYAEYDYYDDYYKLGPFIRQK